MQRALLIAGSGLGLGVLAAGLLRVEPQPLPAPPAAAPVLGADPVASPPWARALSEDLPVGPDGALLDVSLDRVTRLTYRNRVGAYPTGRAGFAMETTSCNVGNVDVPWFAPMDPRHPFIAQNMYRQVDGRLEMIGVAWLKHAFFAADAFGCGDCQFDAFDDHLNVGCADTYGVSNNSDRTWLGPRFEVNPLTAEWDPCGSHFDIGDGSEPDCERSHFSSGHGEIDHLLRVDDADLDDPDATFFYEAIYYVADDQNIYNNAGYRRASMTRDGDEWIPFTEGFQTIAPIVFSWGDQQAFADPRDDGDVIVAGAVDDNGDGTWRYTYVVYNYNHFRAVNALRIPVATGTSVTGFGFKAPIEEEEPFSNEPWDAAVIDDVVVFSTDDHATDPRSNTVRFGTAYTFWFDADVPPAQTTVTLDVHEPGDFPAMTAGTIGPAGGEASTLALSATRFQPGKVAEVAVEGADPGEPVYFLYSRNGLGRTFSPGLGLEVDLRQPIEIAGIRTADADGRASISVTIPNSAPEIDIGLQAVVDRGPAASLESNVAIRPVR